MEKWALKKHIHLAVLMILKLVMRVFDIPLVLTGQNGEVLNSPVQNCTSGNSMCIEVSFSCNVVWGLGVVSKYEKFTLRSRVRHFQNSVVWEPFYQRISHCAVDLRKARLTSNKNLGCEKPKMAELRNTEFFSHVR